MVRPKSTAQKTECALLGLVAAGFAFWLVGLQQMHLVEHRAYYFFSGAIAICAMILPGISGAYVLWLLGAYEAVTGLIERLLDRQFTSADFATLIVFVSGCLLGLLVFSKLLRWLLSK